MLDAPAAARLIASSSDLALIVDPRGVIRDVAVQNDELREDLGDAARWRGKPWERIVTVESRPKVASMLAAAREASPEGAPVRWRHVNHPVATGDDVAVLCTAVPIDEERIVAFGRDLRPQIALQQRLLAAQDSLERDYEAMREAEARYRLLFDGAGDPMLVVDAESGRVTELNPTAGRLLGEAAGRRARPLVELLGEPGRDQVAAAFREAAATGRGGPVAAQLRDGTELALHASLLRHAGRERLLLVRLAAGRSERGEPMIDPLLAGLPDGFALADGNGVLLDANAAFLQLVDVPAGKLASGRSLDEWLGRPGVDLGVLLAHLRQRGSLRGFATTLRGERGGTTEVEISAAAIGEAGALRIGMLVRDVGRRTGGDLPVLMPRSAAQLTELVGRMPLKELVRDATDVIEWLCIEAALELTGDNRASAAEMLGLSRQSLYVKLRRYGLGDLPEEEA